MKRILVPIFLYALPLVSFAQFDESGFTSAYGGGGGSVNTGPLKNLIQSIGGLFNALIPVLIAAALVIFFWGLVQYVRGGGKDTARGRQIMVSGLVALFVMVSVWGIIRLLQDSLGVDQNATTNVPQIPVNGS